MLEFLLWMQRGHFYEQIPHSPVFLTFPTQVGNKSWPVHKYIVAMRSDVFKNMVTVSASQKGEMLNLKADNVSPEIMEQLITFMYTDMCDFLQVSCFPIDTPFLYVYLCVLIFMYVHQPRVLKSVRVYPRFYVFPLLLYYIFPLCLPL